MVQGLYEKEPWTYSAEKPSRLSTARGRAMNRAVVGDYFQDVAKYTEGMQPISIWNMDESGFHFEHQPTKVVCKKGVLAVNSRESSSREHVTVVASAASVVMPPMFIHSYNTVEAPPNNKWTWQAKAWMEDSLGIEWFREVFLKYCGVQRPQVLLLDQHHSHEISVCSGFMVVNKVTFTRLFAEAWERSIRLPVTGICPVSPGCLPEMAFATCFQEVSVAVSVPAPTELDASGELQPCGSDEP
ncbi:hypothetical protein LSH36_1095g00008 [Paralvinella palmiformis]|uniref:DDE-1 domain-containing protein n=1 Tax=Paralvinella palmiformis TaxID=53620 RepID=A0AAD9IVQ5_9ANNE|nr:hypothetical protein LSH36_1095g00008 [Paralvinella palmiformis]